MTAKGRCGESDWESAQQPKLALVVQLQQFGHPCQRHCYADSQHRVLGVPDCTASNLEQMPPVWTQVLMEMMHISAIRPKFINKFTCA